MNLEIIIGKILFILFLLFIGWFFFNPITWWKSTKACRKEGHILRINLSGVKVPRHGLTHCVRCSRYLGTKEQFPNIKIKGYENYPYQYDNF